MAILIFPLMILKKNNIDVQRIGYHYGIQDISVYFESSQIYGILGPNGAGKTTLFSLLCGLKKVKNGDIFLNHIKINDDPLYERSKLGIGYLPQESSIFKDLSVFDNLLMILEIVEPNRSLQKEKALDLLNSFELTHLQSQKAHTLSGGERRRLEIARCLITSPQFLFLDEPFAGIDPISIANICHFLKELKNQGMGIIITDHNILETLRLVDFAYIIAGGTVIAKGTPAEVSAHQSVRETYLGNHFSL
jgi:lipopolysaccharide export system ATP-binding protein